MKHCKKCFYYGGRTKTCDYLLITEQRRGCPPEECTHFKDRDNKRKILFARTTIPTYAVEIPENKKSLVLELYRQGYVDVEIATKLKLEPRQVYAWRNKRGLASNYVKGEDDNDPDSY